MPELRKDLVTNRWVIISSERASRPTDFSICEPKKRDTKFCPFCPGNENKLPNEILRIYGKNNDFVKVVPNKFPALKVEGELNKRGEGIYDLMNGIGAHEIIIETQNHEKTLKDLEPEDITNVLKAYKLRILDLKNDIRIKYILIFKNFGEAAGATLEHSHSQLIGLPIIPHLPEEELQVSKEYYNYKERCVFCDIINQEIKDNVRLITMNDNFVAFAPFASRQAFETWILPKRHNSNFEDTRDDEFFSLAVILKDVLQKLDKALNAPAYNFVLHSAPIQDEKVEHYHWHIEIIPKLSKVAGFEWGSGFYINHVKPEDAVQYIKKV